MFSLYDKIYIIYNYVMQYRGEFILSVTIKDVAKAAGVSVATVSRVLNNTAVVSETAARQVRSAIKELGYSPNFLGRNLRKRETNMILAVIPNMENTLYCDIIRGMQDGASPDYDVLMCTTGGNIKLEERLLGMLYKRTVDGAVFLGTRLNADTINSLKDNYHIALCCERVEGTKILTVTVDDEKCGFDAAEALIKAGHKRIAIISAGNLSPSSIDREKGYRAALSHFGLGCSEELICHGSFLYEDGGKALDRLLSLSDPPTAVFCISDLLAMSAIKAAEAKGLEAGKDIDIVGFDNGFTARVYSPGITTVSQPGYDMGYKVVQLLKDNILHGTGHSEHIIMAHSLIRRESALRNN